MLQGHSYVEESGTPPQETSVHRMVYAASGTLLHDDTWTSLLRGREARHQGRDEGASAAAPAYDDDRDRDHADDDHADAHRDDADYPDVDSAAEDSARSARSNSALSHSGMRVGRSVRASTHACDVQPSAIGSPARSIA